MSNFLNKLRANSRKTLHWIRVHIPPGLRLILGLLLIIGGILGALPILGFWMIPLGIAVALLDLRPIYRVVRDRLKGKGM